MKTILILITLTILLFNPLYAYLDPGTGSMFLQLLLGGIAGVAVVIRLYWRKIVAKISGKPVKTDPVIEDEE